MKPKREDMGFRILGEELFGLDITERQALGMGSLSGAGIAPLAYLLQDEFTTPLPAGSVHNSASEPGPGTRVVQDSGSFLSLTGGRAACADVTGTGDPSILSNIAVSRVAGRLGIGTFTPKDRGYLGFGIATTGAPLKAYMGTLANNVISVGDAGGVGGSVAPATTNGTVEYQFLIALRAAGMFAFVKGGAFTNYTMVWEGNADATATLYFGFAGRVGGSDQESSDYIRVPSNRFWLPTPLASDGFGGVAGVTDGLGHAEGVATGLGAGGGSVAWVDKVGSFANAGGARKGTLDAGVAICTLDCGKINSLISVECTRNAAEMGIVARYVDASNYLRCYHDGTNVKIDSVVAGVVANLATTAVAYSAGKELRLHFESATTCRAFYNNTAAGSIATVPAALASATLVGLYTTDADNAFNDFKCYARGEAGEYENFLA